MHTEEDPLAHSVVIMPVTIQHSTMLSHLQGINLMSNILMICPIHDKQSTQNEQTWTAKFHLVLHPSPTPRRANRLATCERRNKTVSDHGEAGLKYPHRPPPSFKALLAQHTSEGALATHPNPGRTPTPPQQMPPQAPDCHGLTYQCQCFLFRHYLTSFTSCRPLYTPPSFPCHARMTEPTHQVSHQVGQPVVEPPPMPAASQLAGSAARPCRRVLKRCSVSVMKQASDGPWQYQAGIRVHSW